MAPLRIILLCLAVCLVTEAKMSDHDGEKPVAPSDQPADVGSDAKQPNSDKNSDSSSGPDSAKVYQKLFKHKRAEQNEAVKTILNMPDVKKRTKLVEQLVTAIHKACE
uniref:Uncharacterized protein n=1 Tax=Plectus sambesii TaxID=2011161 RepID=A0A914X7L6_9BILA